MAKQNRTTLKTYFQQGDIPTQGQYADLIDSQLNLHDGGTQILSGSVSASNFVSSAGISLAGTISSSGNLEIGHITSSEGASIAGKLTAASAVITDITGSNISASLQLITDKIQQGSAANGINIIGHITSSGNISSSGTITGDTLVTNNFTPTHITASGNISASGIIRASSGDFGDGNITNVGSISADILQADGTQIQIGANAVSENAIYLKGNVTASGNISSSGHIIGARVYPNGFSSQPFLSTANGQIISSTGLAGTNITASSNISASGALIGKTLTLGGTAVTSTAAEINKLDGVTATTAEINFLDGVLSNVKEAYDTVANVSQGVIRFTELDNGTDDLTLTNLSTSGQPSFRGLTLTGDVDPIAYTWDGGATINKPSFSFYADITGIGPGVSSTVQTITNSSVSATSVIIGSCNLKLDVVSVNVVNGSFKFMLVNHSSTDAEEVGEGEQAIINFVIL